MDVESRYVAKPNTWFKENTEVKLIDDFREYDSDGNILRFDMGLFEGVRVCQNPLSEGRWKGIGEEYLDQEVCGFDEFYLII